MSLDLFPVELPATWAAAESRYADELFHHWMAIGKNPLTQKEKDHAAHRATVFMDAIRGGDLKVLASSLYPDSPLSRSWFMLLTGVDLGQTVRDMKTALRQWCQQRTLKIAFLHRATSDILPSRRPATPDN